MPAKHGGDEQVFIRLFVSAYENFAWVESKIDPIDERVDGALEALVTRADGQTLAIEHALVEPFVGDKDDYAVFERAFLSKVSPTRRFSVEVQLVIRYRLLQTPNILDDIQGKVRNDK